MNMNVTHNIKSKNVISIQRLPEYKLIHKPIYKQSGISSLGLLCLLLALGGAITLGLKVVPLYMANNAIDQAFASASSSNFNDMTKGEIRTRLNKTFQINGIDIKTNDIEIIQKNSETTLSYVHEERATLFSNVDIAIRFENYFSTSDQQSP